MEVNAFGAVNTCTSSDVCSTFPQTDYSSSTVASYYDTVPLKPAGATFLQAGVASLSCPQAYSGWEIDASYATGGTTSNLYSITTIVQSPISAPLSAAEAAWSLFSNNRYGRFSYNIPVPAAGWYGIRLLFAENFWASPDMNTGNSIQAVSSCRHSARGTHLCPFSPAFLRVCPQFSWLSSILCRCPR